MQFTAREQKLLNRMRKYERRWRWFRWVLLGLSFLCFASYGYIGISLYNRLHWDNLTTEDCFLVAIYWPKLILGMVFGIWFAVWPLTSWQGNATRMLLLKLVDAHSEGGDENKG